MRGLCAGLRFIVMDALWPRRGVGVARQALALALTLAVIGSWQLTTLVDYTRSLFQRIPSLFA
jgi:hypothetical protein